MAVNLSPIGNDAPFVDASGNPLNAGQLFTFTASSSTPENTYTTSLGNVANANPVVLDSNGYPSSGSSVVEIWLTAGVSYKFVLKTAAGVTVWTRDNISGINDQSNALDQWVVGPAPTFVSGTQFTLVGDQTSSAHVGRRVKVVDSGGTKYGYITASVFAVLTTVTVEIDAGGSLASPTTALSYGLLTSTNPSTPLLTDAYPIVSGSADKTKRLKFEIDGLTTATTRVLTVPDADTKIGPSVISVGRNIASRTDASTPNSKINITADELLLKDSNSLPVLASTVSVTIDITASGANGLDTGAEASSTWYYGWVIAKADGTVAGLISASSSAPTMPTGYTFKAMVAAVRNDGSSNFIKYRQYGSSVWYETEQTVATSLGATSETAQTVATQVPPIAREFILIAFGEITSDGSGNFNASVTFRFTTGATFISPGARLNAVGVSVPQTVFANQQFKMPNEGQQFLYLWTIGAGTTPDLDVWVSGFRLPGGGE